MSRGPRATTERYHLAVILGVVGNLIPNGSKAASEPCSETASAAEVGHDASASGHKFLEISGKSAFDSASTRTVQFQHHYDRRNIIPARI